MPADRVRDLEARLAQPPSGEVFTDDELAGLPEPVRRYFRVSVAHGTPLAVSARLQMLGTIKIGRWLPFRAREVLTPQVGFVWAARVAGVIVGSDRYADGHGGMDWRLAGLVRLAHADGPDVSRSAAERAGAEALWIPTALLPCFGVEWSAGDDRHISAAYQTNGRPLRLDFELASDGHIRSFVFQRWGDPDRTGSWDLHPCGGEVTARRAFGGLTIPAAGRLGWYYGSDRWPEGEFFRYRITNLQLVKRRAR